MYKSGASKLVQELRLPGGSKIVNTHDGNARLTNTKLQNSSATILNQHTYLYNMGNQRTKQTFTEGNYVDYTYDDIGQLKTAIGFESGGVTARLQEQHGYAYDAAGNLNYRTNNALVQDFNVNALNQLNTVGRSGTYTVAGKVANGVPPVTVTVNGQSASVYGDLTFAKASFSLADGMNSFTAIANDDASQSATNVINAYLPATAGYQYDSNGNMLSDGRRAFSYDDENQLVSVLVTNGWKSEFAYDGMNRRRIRSEFVWVADAWLQTNEVRYVYDGDIVLQERDAGNQAMVTYTRGVGLSGTLIGSGGVGGLLARSGHGSLSGSLHAFYHADANGNVVMLVNREGAVVAEYGYDPVGNVLRKLGVLADMNLYRFSSKEAHISSGLIYYLYRYYDPVISRWINSDPIGEEGGMNLYEFAFNDSVNLWDSYGHQVVVEEPPTQKPPTQKPPAPKPPTPKPPVPKPPTPKPPVPKPPTPKPPMPKPPIKVGPPQLIVCMQTFCCVYDLTEVVCQQTGVHDWLGNKICKSPEQKECDKEWDDAFKMCKEELAKPNPSKELTGGYKNIMDCARGLVSELCGGNAVDYGKGKK